MELKENHIQTNEELCNEVELDFDEAFCSPICSPMVLTVDREHIRKVAEEQGFKVEFDSPTPGVLDPETGEITSFLEVMKNFLEPAEPTLEENLQDALQLYLKERFITDLTDEKLEEISNRLLRKIEQSARVYADQIREMIDDSGQITVKKITK